MKEGSEGKKIPVSLESNLEGIEGNVSEMMAEETHPKNKNHSDGAI